MLIVQFGAFFSEKGGEGENTKDKFTFRALIKKNLCLKDFLKDSLKI